MKSNVAYRHTVVSATTLHDDAAQLSWPNLTVAPPSTDNSGLE